MHTINHLLHHLFRPRLHLFGLLLVAGLPVLTAQNSVFILVDVSASGPDIQIVREEAKGIVHDICTGNYAPENYQTEWEWSDIMDPQLAAHVQGQKGGLINPQRRGFVTIMPFGSKDTYKGYRTNPFAGDISSFSEFYHEYFPRHFNDRHTYIDIAEAKAADIARERKMDSYWLIEITDQLQDTDSKAPHYSTKERSLIEQYGTAGVAETKLGTLWHTGQQKNYQIIFKMVKMGTNKASTPEENAGPSPEPPVSESPSLSFVRPTKKGKQKPNVLEAEELTVVWNCRNCPREVAFSLRLDCQDCPGSKTYESQSTRTSQANFKLAESGLYKLSLVTKNLPNNLSTITYIQVDTGKGGGGSFLSGFVIVVILGSIIYLVYKQVLQTQVTAATKPGGNFDTRNPTGSPEAPANRPSPDEENLQDLFDNL
ncbi:MAG: hypothetical protein AAFZ63_20680 [Bacteroidota bacterium]